MFRRMWLLSAVALMPAGAALAADIPAVEPAAAVAVPSFSWSGPYVGVQAGYDWLNADNKVNGFSANSKPDGFTVGGFAGLNYQFDNSPVVVGIEGDFNYADAKGGRVTQAFKGFPDSRIKNDVDWTGAVRGRLGYAFDRFLVYGAGGVAFADHEVKARGSSDDTIAVGWTIGGGLEAALGDNLTARVEYRYSDFGSDSFSVAKSRVKADVSDNRVLLGLGYKFSTGW